MIDARVMPRPYYRPLP
ncbi:MULTISPECIES: hypothetical protein [unclassified Caulobacter]|nr:hypothetical protein [Caulobacter sp. UNC358MFTsu5.1]